jgi:hypothetical protein
LKEGSSQRWAARFLRQAPEPTSEKSEYEKQSQSSACPPKPKGKPADLSRGGDAGP